ncbi:MAG: sulfatase-like hydrolase/transferase [Sedimentisphaerales bacterium]|nr:sulfatase-like hydrolase/transferase [Sedimentisphaerales bacterium]
MYSVLVFGALLCTVAVKLFQACRSGQASQWWLWVLVDIYVLLFIEAGISLICFRWLRKWVFRVVTLLSAVVCTWSVIYAGYLIRMGTEALPRVLLPVVRDPINAGRMIGGNLIKAPIASILLLGPSFLALAILIAVLIRPRLVPYSRRRFTVRVAVCLAIALVALIVRAYLGNNSEYGRNPQVRAIVSLFHGRLEESKRRMPVFDEIELPRRTGGVNYNVVIVVLEGVQYAYTSLGRNGAASTPYLASLAQQGVEFANMRSSVTHTTKALFSLLTGRLPSASEDLAEAVPVSKPYSALATILRMQAGYRTAFFQSAQGDFESRPGLVHNLGYEKFWARDDLGDPNQYIYYLACDEFALLEHVVEWISGDDKPFLLTFLCSVTHDPYDVPEWYGERAKEPENRYRQTVEYTDAFLRELDVRLGNLGLARNTILCVVGDHGEAFGEHGKRGHDQIPYEEALRIPCCLRAPKAVEAGRKVTVPTSSIDLTPTLLGLLGFETAAAGYDGVDALGPIPERRRVYFSGWVREGPSGFVQGDNKFVYDPISKSLCFYDLAADPGETTRIDLPQEGADAIAESIIGWRKNTVFRLVQKQRGRQTLFDRWLVWWSSRVFVRAEYQDDL